MSSPTSLMLAKLCGGCHQWGANPRINSGKCQTCYRTEAEIQEAHGVVILNNLTRACIFATLTKEKGAAVQDIIYHITEALK